GEDDQRDTVADAALRDLLTEPHDECGAGGQREDRHDREAEAPECVLHVSRNERRATGRVLAAKPECDAERLHDRESNRAVARVLIDLAASHLALFRELLEI